MICTGCSTASKTVGPPNMGLGFDTSVIRQERMRLDEIDLLGKPTPSFDAIRKKHRVSYARLKIQLSKGIKIELEHTGDVALAREIALDHLNEFPDYYDRLENVEKK